MITAVDNVGSAREILIIEDHDDTAHMLSAVLQIVGYASSRARHGIEGLRLMRDRMPCLVIVDLYMPLLDGIAFWQEQRLDPILSAVPVVAYTGMYECAAIERDLGIPCVAKLDDLSELLEVVEWACGGRPAASEKPFA